MIKRVFLIVMDSLGIGAMPDAGEYGDEGSDTLGAISESEFFYTPTLKKLGLFNIDGVSVKEKEKNPKASFARFSERSKGKDTTTGHWEIAGIVSDKPLPTYPDGFPDYIIKEFERRTGKGVLCNKPYSGTQVIYDYGAEHLRTGKLIVYTSADSVFQIAAHESVVPVNELYNYCRIARSIMQGEDGVGRIIARPFEGVYPEFKRTENRHDYSLEPPKETILDILRDNGLETLAVGKINDIFAGKGVSEAFTAKNNSEGMKVTASLLDRDFIGLCFVNLVDFDMLYGHRNDIEGYAKALSVFDAELKGFNEKLKDGDVCILTADHGCDPSTPSTDHSREYVPMLIYGKKIKKGVNLGTRNGFSDIGATILDIFKIKNTAEGDSFLKEVIKNGK